MVKQQSHSASNANDSNAASSGHRPSIKNLPQLQIVAISDIFPHEVHDDQRLEPLINELQKSGFLTNPPIITPGLDENGCYMVLDGANRVNAFKRMGIPHILAQVVSADDPGLQMHTWNHIIWGITPEQLLSSIKQLPRMALQSGIDHQSAISRIKTQDLLFSLQTPDQVIHTPTIAVTDLMGRIDVLSQVVTAYHEQASLDRTAIQHIESLLGLYQQLGGLLVFPHFSIHDVLKVCQAGCLMPPGITRTVISPRALRLNYPLDELASEGSLDQKNATFHRWLQERLAKRGVRFYQEGTVIFDE